MSDLMTESAAETWLAISTDTRVLVPVGSFPVDDLEALADSGLISVCTWEGSEVATLTPLSASRLGLRIGPRLTWVDASVRPKRRKPNRSADEGYPLDSRPDERAERPDEVAIANERIEREAERQLGRRSVRRTDAELSGRDLPSPSNLLEGCRAWDAVPSVPCRACKGSRLSPSTYCLVCDRWGLDWLLARIRSHFAAQTKRRKKVAS